MARDKIDEVPMLLDSQSQGFQDYAPPEVEFPSFAMGRSPSISMSGGLRQHEKERKVVPFSGPLRSKSRGSVLIPMSGPIQNHRGLEGAGVSTSGPLGNDRRMDERLTNSQSTAIRIGGEHGMNENYGGKHEHLLKSGPLGRCNDPFCTTCPSYYDYKDTQVKKSQLRPIFDHKDYNCIVINWTLTTVITVMRSMTDFVYFLHMLLQFRLAYVAPESRVVGAGDLVDDPKEIAHHYLFGYFIVDLFVVLPLPQQISTLAGNQVPSLFVWEVLFTMGIVGLGLLLFALLIGNMQNFLQSLGRRRLEMQLRRRDVELWMGRRRLPAHVRRCTRSGRYEQLNFGKIVKLIPLSPYALYCL